MSDAGDKKAPSPDAIANDAIVAKARAAMADLFSQTINAMATDIEKTLSTNFTRGSEVEKAVTKVTSEMIKMLASQVASVLPQQAGTQSQADPSPAEPAGQGDGTKTDPDGQKVP